jgi:hypothetical protein
MTSQASALVTSLRACTRTAVNKPARVVSQHTDINAAADAGDTG